MLPYLLIFTISAVTAQSCDYKYNDRLYSRRSLLNTDYDDIATLPTNLVYDPRSGDLLFTLVDLKSLQDDDDEHTFMDEYILHNGESTKIERINGQGQAAAVDLKNHTVYVASNRGLHTMNGIDRLSFLFHIHSDIVQLIKPAHKDELYVVTLPEHKVSVLNLKTITWNSVEHVPYAFILAEDSHGNIFHVTESKDVEVLIKDFHERVKFIGLGKDTARAIAVDEADRVILAANDGLYHLRPDNVLPIKMMNLDFVPSGIAFNKDHIFLSTNGTIYKYSPCYRKLEL